MSTVFEIVKYNSGFKRPVVELQKQLWSSDTGLNERYFEWKYERNPHLRESHVYLAIHRNNVVGMRGFHEARLEAGTPSRTFPVLIAGDAVVSPDHRNRGLVSRLLKMAYVDLADREYGYCVSLGGASRVNALGLMALGWKSGGGLQPMGRTSTTAERSRKVRQTLKRFPLFWRFSEARSLYFIDQRTPFRHLDGARRGHGPGEDLPIVVERSPRLDAMVGLVERLGHDGRIRYVRDCEYLAWRFQNPLGDYRFLYWEDTRLEGYLVLCSRASDLGAFDRVYIADLVASNMRVRSGLLAAAARWGRFPEFVTWTATLSEDELQDLRRQGFAPVDQEDRARGCPCILVRPLRDGSSASDWSLGDRRLLDMRNWDVRPLFSMRA
jgi:GNAT superfamily N-acetyltransferase